MTLLGWALLVLSLGFVTGLTTWCFYRVLSPGGETRVEPSDSLGD
jgi:hypothetical protein